MNTEIQRQELPQRLPALRSPKKASRDLTGRVFGELTVLSRAEAKGKNRGIRWLCQCSCGAEYETLGTHLTTGKRTNCGGKAHPKNYPITDITGETFGSLTALEPTKQRDAKGFVIWKCLCECGKEAYVSYNDLRYANVKSCGCSKKAHDQKLHGYLTHMDGTSLEMLQSKKLPADNTTGYRGVYHIRGKYVAKIVFQGKAYYLGNFSRIEAAAEARKEAEELLFDGSAEFYRRWKAKADEDPAWAEENPIRIHVTNDRQRGLQVEYEPAI